MVSIIMTAKHQVTIPKVVRDWLKLQKSDTLEFQIDAQGQVKLKKAPANDLWQVMAAQEKKDGPVTTPELDWGPDQGTEVSD